MARFPGEKGQSLIEILIAFTLIVLGIGSATILVFGGQGLLIDRENTVQARSRAQEGLLAVGQMIENDWDSVSDGTYGVVFTNGMWQLSGGSDGDDRYTRHVSVTSTDDNRKEITSSVVWESGGERSRIVKFVTLVTNWQNAVFPPTDPGDPGGGGVSGDWQNPRTLGSVDLGPGNEATGIDVLNKIAYLSAKASAENKPDFWVVDATDGENPFVVSSINTGPGLNAVDVSGNYAYVANDDEENQLQIIDISQTSNPVLVSSLTFTDADEGLHVFYLNNKIYVSTEEAKEGREFHIVDVTNPSTPSLLGSLEIGDDVSAIYIKDSKAYLATSNSAELQVVDVSDPVNPSIVGTYDALGNSEDGKSIYLVGNRAYLGRTKGGNHDDHHELHIVDISTPDSVTTLGSEDLAVDINGIRVRNYLAFFATSDSNEEFQVWNISDPAGIFKISSFNFSQVGTGIDYEDNIVYISVRSNDALRIITSSP